jgi:2'-5' RNA ligase
MSYFVGLPLTYEARRGMERVNRVLSRKHWQVRFVPAENWHATVLFLGNMSDVSTTLTAFYAALEGVGPFTLGLKGLGRFPQPKSGVTFGERVCGRTLRYLPVRPRGQLVLPQVLYVSLKGDLKAFHRLGKRMRETFDESGINYDRKPLTAHVTIGRVMEMATHGQRVQIAQEVDKLSRIDIPQQWDVAWACLYESVRDGAGSGYNVVKAVRLD